MLSVKELHAYYGRAHILHGISLQAAAGEVVAVISGVSPGERVSAHPPALVPRAQSDVTGLITSSMRSRAWRSVTSWPCRIT